MSSLLQLHDTHVVAHAIGVIALVCGAGMALGSVTTARVRSEQRDRVVEGDPECLDGRVAPVIDVGVPEPCLEPLQPGKVPVPSASRWTWTHPIVSARLSGRRSWNTEPVPSPVGSS
jgi:hypothetical protein